MRQPIHSVRRGWVLGFCVVAVLASSCTTTATDHEEKTVACPPESLTVVDEKLIPECGVLFGTLDPSPAIVSATATPIGLEHQREAVRGADVNFSDFDFGITRRYQRGSKTAVEVLDGLLRKAALTTGRRIYFSWKVDVGEGAWAAVAAGSHDDALRDVASTIDGHDQAVFLSLHHEPENDAEGSADDYIAMWQHAHDVVTATLATLPGAGTAVWVMDYMGHIDGNNLDQVDAYYPGNDYVDWIAFNPYNWKHCGGQTWQPFADVARPMVEYLTTNSRYLTDGEPKPLMVGETGTHEHESDVAGKAQWFADMSAALHSDDFAALKAVVYFNQADPNFCDWYWDSSPAAAEAFINIVTDPFFHPASSG